MFPRICSAHFALQHPRGIAFPIIVRGPDFPPDYPFAAQLAAARDVVMMIADFCPYATDLGDQSNPTCDGRNVAAYLDSKFSGNATDGKARVCVATATATDVLFLVCVGQTAITVRFSSTRNSIFVVITETQYSSRSLINRQQQIICFA